MNDKFGCPYKQESRLEIWKTIARRVHPPLARILFFPGSHSYELDTVLSLGFRPENIYLVEKNAAVKANFTRNARQGVSPSTDHFLRMRVSEAANKLKEKKIVIDAAHLDFCSHCESGEMFSETQKFLRSGVVKDNGFVAVTVLAGREMEIEQINGMSQSFGVQARDGLDSKFSLLSRSDQGRFYRVWHAVGAELHTINFGRYYNTYTRNPMIWAIFQTRRLKESNHE